MRASLAAFLVVMAGCGGDGELGSADGGAVDATDARPDRPASGKSVSDVAIGLCIDRDDVQGPPATQPRTLFAFPATVITHDVRKHTMPSGAGSVGPVVATCDGETAYDYLELAEEAAPSRHWYLYYVVEHREGGAPVRTRLQVADGDHVDVRLRVTAGFGYAGGFAASTDGQLRLAVEYGVWGTTLEDADHPGLSVAPGPELGRSNVSCGTRIDRTQRFAFGGTTIDVGPSQLASLGVAPTTAQVLVGESYDWADVRCTDLAGAVTWASWWP